jgi:hypothetical protein
MSLTREVDERTQMRARLYGTTYSAPRFDNDSRSRGVEAEYMRPLTETLRFSLNIGVARTVYNFLDAGTDRVEGTNNGFTLGFDVEKRTERTSFSIAAGRTVSPGTTGFLAPRDDFGFSVRHQINQRFRILGGIRAAEIGVVRGATASPRNYARATIELEWMLRERWSVRGGYDHVREQFGDAAATEASSNAIYLGIRYRGQSRR